MSVSAPNQYEETLRSADDSFTLGYRESDLKERIQFVRVASIQYRMALLLEDAKPKVWKRYITCCVMLGEFDKGAKAADEAKQKFPKSFFFNQKLECETGLAAKSLFFSSLDDYVKFFEVLQTKGKEAFKDAKKSENWQEALSFFETYYLLNNTNLAALAALGVCCQRDKREGSQKKADFYFTSVTRAFPPLQNLDHSISDEKAFIENIFQETKMLIRPCFRQDLEAINELYSTNSALSFDDAYPMLYSYIKYNGVAQYCRKKCLEEVFVVQLPHSLKAQGLLLLRFEKIDSSNPSGGDNKCTILAMKVSEKYQRFGFEKPLIEFANRRALQNNCHSRNLNCESLTFRAFGQASRPI